MKLVFDELNEFEHNYGYGYHRFARERGPKYKEYVYTSTLFSDTSYKGEGPWGNRKLIYTAPNDSIRYETWESYRLIEEHTVDLKKN